MDNAEHRKYSIIVLTYNSERTIRDCLHGIKKLDYPFLFLQVIILDNGSTDKTTDIISEMGFQYHSLPELNLSELRNYGASIAEGDVIGFIDSDCVVYPDWVKQVDKWFDDPHIGIVGNEYSLPENASYFEKNWYPKSNYGLQYDGLIPGGNMAVAKEKFIRLGGFKPSLITGEDSYLLQKFRDSGYKTISDDAVRCIHLGNSRNLKEYYKKEVWYGIGMLGTVTLRRFDKPFFLTNVYLVLILLLMVSICSSILGFKAISNSVTFISCLGLIGIPFLATIHRIFIKKIRGNFVYVLITFVVFFLARIHSLAYVYNLRSFKRK